MKSLCDYANGADASLKTVLWANITCDDGRARSVAPAGSYKPNMFGLHDMQGNVWEWVQDCYAADVSGTPNDGSPREATTGACGLRIAKGGSWRSGPEALGIAAYQAFAPGEPRATVGFRVAQDLD